MAKNVYHVEVMTRERRAGDTVTAASYSGAIQQVKRLPWVTQAVNRAGRIGEPVTLRIERRS